MRLIVCLILSIACTPLFAQRVLTEAELMAAVQQFHPVAQQADLGIRIADANVTAARGGFDPELNINHNRKNFDGSTYYDHRLAELRIPTWYGIDLHTGIETATGSRINPEETSGTIEYVGVSVPVLRNLVLDGRRAALMQARIFRSQSEVIRSSILNNLVRDAYSAYWKWWEDHHTLAVVDSTLEVTRKRLDLVRSAYRLGDRPAIDTTEALTQVQQLEQAVIAQSGKLAQSRLQLSLYLWERGGSGYELPADVVPQPFTRVRDVMLDSLIQSATTHPDLIEYEFKIRSLNLERRLKFQSILPDIKLKYNQTERDFSKIPNAAWLSGNYRFGIGMSLPLRLSEGRGEFQAARLKLEQTRLARQQKQLQVQTYVRQYFTEWLQVTRQLDMQEAILANFVKLQTGEEIKFDNGESSLFLLNARQMKTMEARQKLVALQAQHKRAAISLQWAAGRYAE